MAAAIWLPLRVEVPSVSNPLTSAAVPGKFTGSDSAPDFTTSRNVRIGSECRSITTTFKPFGRTRTTGEGRTKGLGGNASGGISRARERAAKSRAARQKNPSFGVRQLAAAFVFSSCSSRCLDRVANKEKRQQAAALQIPPGSLGWFLHWPAAPCSLATLSPAVLVRVNLHQVQILRCEVFPRHTLNVRRGDGLKSGKLRVDQVGILQNDCRIAEFLSSRLHGLPRLRMKSRRTRLLAFSNSALVTSRVFNLISSVSTSASPSAGGWPGFIIARTKKRFGSSVKLPVPVALGMVSLKQD